MMESSFTTKCLAICAALSVVVKFGEAAASLRKHSNLCVRHDVHNCYNCRICGPEEEHGVHTEY
jgi:hypothetical protein